MTPFLFNLGLAVAWCAVTGNLAFDNLLFGFALGYVCLALARPTPEAEDYSQRIWKAVGFSAYFLMELLRANWRLALDVLTPTNYFRPRILLVPLELRGDLEITVFASVVSLTPGSLSIDVDREARRIYIHFTYAQDRDAVLSQIKSLERRLQALR